MPACPPGCKSSCCAAVSCSDLCRIPEDPVAHLRDMTVKQLSGTYEQASSEINEFIRSIGRALNESNVDFNATATIQSLNGKVEKIVGVQSSITNELTIRSSKKDQCLSWSYATAETCFYFSTSTLAKILTIAGLIWGWYQTYIGGSGTVVTAIAIGLFIFQFGFEILQAKVKRKLDAHHFSIQELAGLKARTELEVERAGSFLRIFQGATAQLPQIKGDVRLRNQAQQVLSALPPNYRKSFSVEGLAKLSNRSLTLPPSHKHAPSRGQMDLAAVRRALSSDEGEGLRVRFLEPPATGPDRKEGAGEVRVIFQELEKKEGSSAAASSAVEDEGSGLSFTLHEDPVAGDASASQHQEAQAVELTTSAVAQGGAGAAGEASALDLDDEFGDDAQVVW